MSLQDQNNVYLVGAEAVRNYTNFLKGHFDLNDDTAREIPTMSVTEKNIHAARKLVEEDRYVSYVKI